MSSWAAARTAPSGLAAVERRVSQDAQQRPAAAVEHRRQRLREPGRDFGGRVRFDPSEQGPGHVRRDLGVAERRATDLGREHRPRVHVEELLEVTHRPALGGLGHVRREVPLLRRRVDDVAEDLRGVEERRPLDVDLLHEVPRQRMVDDDCEARVTKAARELLRRVGGEVVDDGDVEAFRCHGLLPFCWSHRRLDGIDELPIVGRDLRSEPGDRCRRGPMRNFSKFHRMSPEWPSASATSAELGVDRVPAGAVHLDLLEHRERDAVRRRTERLDLLGASGLLPTELVAGKAEDAESLLAVRLLQLLQAGVLRCQTALRRHVDQQHRVALVLGEASTAHRRAC